MDWILNITCIIFTVVNGALYTWKCMCIRYNINFPLAVFEVEWLMEIQGSFNKIDGDMLQVICPSPH